LIIADTKKEIIEELRKGIIPNCYDGSNDNLIRIIKTIKKI